MTAVLNVRPLPQQYEFRDGRFSVAPGTPPALTVALAPQATAKEALGAAWLRRELRTHLGQEPALRPWSSAELPAEPCVVLGIYGGGRPIDRGIESILEAADRAVLADPAMTEQAYVLTVTPGRVAILGRSDQGALYGVMTLLQLLEIRGATLSAPCLTIRDWPDFRYRIAENWTFAEGRDRAGSGWCYDWGDGADRYNERVERILDRCLRYKINAIMFHGDFYGPLERMWEWRDLAFTRKLSQSARQRGIKLVFGGMGVGGKNRQVYPDGPIYECVGYPGTPPKARTTGTCRSNEALNAMKQDYVREFVRHVEPGALYVHFEDLAEFRHTAECWKLRCAQCRERWPDDTPESPRGAAAGFAHGYDQFCEAVFSVRNDASGYDAARDCLVVLVSPGYTAAGEADGDWDRQVAYWCTVSSLLKHRKNLNFCIREQFLRHDNGRSRVTELAQALRERGGGHGVFVFSLSFTSLYSQGPLFQAYPAIMSAVNEGAQTVYFFSGTLFQEPQILLNAEALWNSTVRGHGELPRTAEACGRLFREYAGGYPRSEAVHAPGGLLEEICTELYGRQAGVPMKRFYELTGKPVCFGRQAVFRREAPGHDWQPHLAATREAIGLVTAALNAGDLRSDNRWIVERLLQALKLGERFAAIRVDYHDLRALPLDAADTLTSLNARSAALEAGIDAMVQELDRFPAAWVTPRGGDFGYWRPALDGTRKELAGWLDKTRTELAAMACALPGSQSLVLNGDMEAEGSWRFETSPAAGYTDGGCVTDRARGGRRSYKIVHPPVADNEPWPEGRVSEWAQIVQELTVEPGQCYVVIFSVYNNYGGARGYLEHQAWLDDRKMWAMDGAESKGWRTGTFTFVARERRVRLALRTTDLRWTGGWHDRGNSWWDEVRVHPARAVSE